MAGTTGGTYGERVKLDSGDGRELSIRVSPRMLDILARATGVAQSTTGQKVIGTEHVLRALVDDPQAIATQVVARHDLLDAVRQDLDQIMASKDYAARPGDAER